MGTHELAQIILGLLGGEMDIAEFDAQLEGEHGAAYNYSRYENEVLISIGGEDLKITITNTN